MPPRGDQGGKGKLSQKTEHQSLKHGPQLRGPDNKEEKDKDDQSGGNKDRQNKPKPVVFHSMQMGLTRGESPG